MTDAGPVRTVGLVSSDWVWAPFAGPVFTEWYWTPIFFVLVYGPPILAVAGVLYLLGHFTGLRRRIRAAAALVAAPVLVLGGVAVANTVRYRAQEAADARGVTFATFHAPSLHQTSASAIEGPWSRLHLAYERGGGELLVTEVGADGDDVTPPACELHDGTPYVAWKGPCRSARTPRGRAAALAEMQRGVTSLLEVRDGTLIVAGEYRGTEADLLALADDLRPVAVQDIHWER